jgi:hypothetical protein
VPSMEHVEDTVREDERLRQGRCMTGRLRPRHDLAEKVGDFH